jgi:transcriptional regulator with XRE-family HTH domain
MATMRLLELLEAADEPDWVIAGICGIHPSALSKYKTGSRAMPTKHAQKLAEHLGVDLDEVRRVLPSRQAESVDPF